MIPAYWSDFVIRNDLPGRDYGIDEGDDLSGIGADFRIMTLDQSVSEATKCHPGIEAMKLGYFPVAMCLSGSGDYYYINALEGEGGALYRIYHDSVVGGGLAAGGIEKVLESYGTLFRR